MCKKYRSTARVQIGIQNHSWGKTAMSKVNQIQKHNNAKNTADNTHLSNVTNRKSLYHRNELKKKGTKTKQLKRETQRNL